LREQLTEARDNVQRQLDILAVGPADNDTRWQPDSVTQLCAVLAELNQRLEELGPEDA